MPHLTSPQNHTMSPRTTLIAACALKLPLLPPIVRPMRNGGQYSPPLSIKKMMMIMISFLAIAWSRVPGISSFKKVT
uniref:Uncharacterized protein n=1 Tax=Anguilla anguilla TaxID=7936 RepID=A0A0E9SCU4_ANGAN